MSGLTIESRETIGSCNITTTGKQFGPDPPKLKMTKQSRVEFQLINTGVSADLKVAFLVNSDQDVDSLKITSHSNLHPRRDPATAAEAEDFFGSHQGVNKWVGWLISYPNAPWPPSVNTEMVLRKFHPNPMHIQHILVVFAFATESGNSFAQHFLPAVSTCMGSGHPLQIETRTVFIP